MIEEMKEIFVESTIDGTIQPNLFYKSEQNNRPLLVGLHTWRYDRFNQVGNMLPLAKRNSWNLLLPEFRGPNSEKNKNSKDACGSVKAKQDIIDAVDYVIQHCEIDTSSILLLGASGGGHMALLMAAYAPKLWKAICSFVPITDVRKWYDENPDYHKAIEACCGNIDDPQFEIECAFRSPINYVDEISRATLKIYSGKWDNIVPCNHGLNIYNEIFNKYPQADVYFDMFDGGHEMLVEDAERWLISRLTRNDIRHTKVTG